VGAYFFIPRDLKYRHIPMFLGSVFTFHPIHSSWVLYMELN